MNIFKKKTISFKLSTISVFDFKQCYNGDLSYFNNDESLWEKCNSEYEKSIKSNSTNLVLELRKQIAIKENTMQILNAYLFIIRNAFDTYINTNDDYWVREIDAASQDMKKYGVYFNPSNDIIKEFKKCVKIVKNKSNDIKQDTTHLKEATKGGITFDKLIAIIGKYSGSGIIPQKVTTMDEFSEFYNLMVGDNGK